VKHFLQDILNLSFYLINSINFRTDSTKYQSYWVNSPCILNLNHKNIVASMLHKSQVIVEDFTQKAYYIDTQYTHFQLK